MRRGLLALFVVGLLAAGCSDDSGDDAETDADMADADDPTDSGDASGETDAGERGDEEAEPDDTTEDEGEPDEEVAEPYAGYVSEVYSDPAVWTCRPGRDDVCARSLDVTVVDGDGSTEVVAVPHATDAPIDCFYLYPTISGDPTPNSDLVPQEDQEIYVTWQQAARFGEVCNVYAPVYRSNTLGSLGGTIEIPEGVNTYEIAYADVADAFRHYIANDNEGRGFVLIGHSQGAGMAFNLVSEEIDGNRVLRDRLVSAALLGTSVAISGDDALENVAGCTAADETNCLISYSTYRETAPPPPGAFFGRTSEGPALCTNPAALGGGAAPLHPQFLYGDDVQGVFGGGVEPFAAPDSAPTLSTHWVTYPDFISGECIDDGTFGYLTLRIAADPTDARTDDISGDLTPEWGMHLVDANVALGDLVEVVATQADAYVAVD